MSYIDFIHICIYANGSKMVAKLVPPSLYGMRLHDNASIFTTEAKAIDLTIMYISQHHRFSF